MFIKKFKRDLNTIKDDIPLEQFVALNSVQTELEAVTVLRDLIKHNYSIELDWLYSTIRTE